MLFSPPERIFSFVYYEVKMNYLEHKTPSNTIALYFEPTTRTNRLFVYIFLTRPEWKVTCTTVLNLIRTNFLFSVNKD